MREKVYFIRSGDDDNDVSVSARLARFVNDNDMLSFVGPRDMVALKTHFGEEGTDGFVRPVYLKALGDLLKQKKATAFLTETSTLYRHRRTNAVDHIALACEHGFTFEATGLPIIMADGLMGDEEHEVEIPGRLYKTIKVAALLAKIQGLIVVSHFTGHLGSGFGAAIKNLAMGCSSRKGKLIQHSTATPSVKADKCTACGECQLWCPSDAISLEDVARIDKKICIGCGECLAMCRFDAIGYNWGTPHVDLQKKMIEHAWGVCECKRGKILFINFLKRITRDCDCLSGFRKIVPDVGILISRSPIAIDAASLDLVEEAARRPLSELAYDVPYRVQLDYAREIGFGSPEYELIEVG